MFERYTERARRVLFFARFEASQFGSVTIEPEHLLLGLLREGKGVTSRLFGRAHLSLDELRRLVEARLTVREKVATSVEIPFSAAAKRALGFAAEESDRLLHNYIGTEHLLLGILREERSGAAAVLNEKDLRYDSVLEHLRQLLDAAETQPPHVEQPTDDEHTAGTPDVSVTLDVVARGRVYWSLQHRDDGYWFVREGQRAEGPYCESCWEDSRRWVRKRPDERGRVACMLCRR